MTKLLILLVLVLAILAVAQLARVYELTSKLRGKREEDISPADNRMNATLWWVFMVVYYAFFIWLIWAYADEMLPVAASAHGEEIDTLMNFNWAIILLVFFVTSTLLFWFAGKYAYRADRKAYYYAHNNKLELVWTVVPASFLAVIIIYGLRTWQDITGPAAPDALQVELYAKQFDWTARYPGDDGMLGATDFRLIDGENPLGIVTKERIAIRLAALAAEKAGLDSLLQHAILPDSRAEEIRDRIAGIERQAGRIVNLRTLMEQDIAEKGEASAYMHGADDVVTKEFHLPLRKEVLLLIRSRDVIHSAYIPHLRAQMNAVPGMTTTFKMVPTITTDSMRQVTGNEAFEYILLCNKICGASHYNMQMPLVVEDQGTYDAWYAQARTKPFQAPPMAVAPTPAPPAPTDSTAAPADSTDATAALKP
ncbi:MAG: cytochrome c oxidase subunit II [Flavobacteriales bacterium]|nr:hypothetical protein [Flavobacteriales bacterium]MCC6578123.1 cytochrome c oxidase subunit II [Flavobacteriales bacterium]NUQ14800.1 cytochrome c oxidase subunit II [Flavobacteriales bacterium]